MPTQTPQITENVVTTQKPDTSEPERSVTVEEIKEEYGETDDKSKYPFKPFYNV